MNYKTSLYLCETFNKVFHLLTLFLLDDTTPTLATDRTCLPMAWLEALAVATVMVAEVSFMPWSFPEEMQDAKQINKIALVAQ